MPPLFSYETKQPPPSQVFSDNVIRICSAIYFQPSSFAAAVTNGLYLLVSTAYSKPTHFLISS